MMGGDGAPGIPQLTISFFFTLPQPFLSLVDDAACLTHNPLPLTHLELVAHGGVALEPCLPEVQALPLVVHPHLLLVVEVMWLEGRG